MFRSRRHHGWLPVLALTGLISMLIWAKLRLVADVPRTAYAEPDRGELYRASTEIPPPQGDGASENARAEAATDPTLRD